MVFKRDLALDSEVQSLVIANSKQGECFLVHMELKDLRKIQKGRAFRVTPHDHHQFYLKPYDVLVLQGQNPQDRILIECPENLPMKTFLKKSNFLL